jgi:hypothetical protein
MKLLGKILQLGNLAIEQLKNKRVILRLSARTRIAKLPDYEITQYSLAGACQFTGLMLRLTISVIFLSINDLNDHFDPRTGSPA